MELSRLCEVSLKAELLSPHRESLPPSCNKSEVYRELPNAKLKSPSQDLGLLSWTRTKGVRGPFVSQGVTVRDAKQQLFSFYC